MNYFSSITLKRYFISGISLLMKSDSLYGSNSVAVDSFLINLRCFYAKIAFCPEGSFS